MLTVNAEVRKDQGKGASRRLRFANKLPAILYGSSKEPLSLALDYDTFINIQKQEGFYTNFLYLVVDSQKNKVRVQAVQHHPFKPKLIHIDFIRA